MTRYVATLVMLMTAISPAAARHAHHASNHPIHGTNAAYPPVSVLQSTLNLHPGDTLPKAVAYANRVFSFTYVRADAHPDGTYVVILRVAQ